MENSCSAFKKILVLDYIKKKKKDEIREAKEGRDALISSGDQYKPGAEVFDFMIKTETEALEKYKNEVKRITEEEIEGRQEAKNDLSSGIKIFVIAPK